MVRVVVRDKDGLQRFRAGFLNPGCYGFSIRLEKRRIDEDGFLSADDKRRDAGETFCRRGEVVRCERHAGSTCSLRIRM